MKVLLLCCLLFIACVPAFAQPDNMYVQDGKDPKRFDGGIILGANFSQVDGDSYYGYHKIGLHTGGMVYVHFNRIFGASMELLYTEKGSRGETITESQSVGTYVAKYFMNLNYVEVPLMLHAILNNSDIEVGASYNRLIKSSEWIQSDQPVVIDPVINRFNNTDVDFICGLTHRLYKNLYANIRYQYSLTSIRPYDRIPYTYSYGTQGQYNNLFNIRFIYVF